MNSTSWYVYLARCGDGSLYTGITRDLARREAEHNAGIGGKYTRSRRPVGICYAERWRGRPAALQREAAVKRLSKADKEKLVHGILKR